MKWEEITSAEFESAQSSCGGVCLLPLGVLEKHGDHLPLGTDGIAAHELAIRAAELEPAMVFPEYYFGPIAVSRPHPGTFSLPFKLICDLLEAICDEISRNGFRKIIIVSGHGGNTPLFNALCETMLQKEKDYMVHFRDYSLVIDNPLMESTAPWRGHADEGETSILMHLRPHAVRSNGVPGTFGYHHHHLKPWEDLGLQTPLSWYAGFPGHLCGDTTPGSAEKGQAIMEQSVKNLVAAIRLVKQNDDAMALYQEFHDHARHPHATYGEE